MILFISVLTGSYIWKWTATRYVLDQRNKTMKVFEDSRRLAFAIAETDAERAAKNQPSIYPRDLGTLSSMEYFSYLHAQGIIKKIPSTIQNLRIGNISRSDDSSTIFIISIGTMRDIHAMIHSIGGVPNYQKGFLSIQKGGKGQFYPSSAPLASTGLKPPCNPPFLSNE